MFTICNVISGFIAIAYISEGYFIYGTLWIIVAAFFDMMDGFIARLLNSTSDFGVQLDSLCDAISFGLAPSFMLYRAFFVDYGVWGIIISALPVAGGVLRLARFNVRQTQFAIDKDFFYGFPIPSAAILITSYVIFFHSPQHQYDRIVHQSMDIIPEEYKPYLIIFITIGVSLAMVSNLKYYNVPAPIIKKMKKKPLTSVFFYSGIILSIITKGLFVFPIMFIFLLSGALRHLFLMLTKANGDRK